MTPSARAPLLLLGGGGHAAVVAETARLCGWSLIGFLDDAAALPQPPLPGLVQLGPIDRLAALLDRREDSVLVHAAVGDSALRRRWLGACATCAAPPIVHPTAVVSSTATLGVGTFIGPGAIVNARACVGAGVIVNSGAIVEHDCQLGDYCHIAPGAVLCGEVTVGDSGLVGAGAVVRPGVIIGAQAVVGVGSAVVGDVPPGSVARGVPARSAD